MVLKRRGSTLRPLRIRLESLKLRQHPIDAISDWQEHSPLSFSEGLLAPYGCFYLRDAVHNSSGYAKVPIVLKK